MSVDRATRTSPDIRTPAERGGHRPAVSATGTRGVTWTVLCAVTALVASVSGLVMRGAYTDAPSTVEMLRAYDLVTAALVVPALALACWHAARGSERARVVSAGLLTGLLYTYAYHAFGTRFGDLFLLHAAVMATGAVALVVTLRGIDLGWCADQLPGRAPSRVVAALLGLLVLGLGGMWVYVALDEVLTGRTPTGSQLVETDAAVHLGMALDLTLLVPLYAAASVQLWQRTGLGYLLGAVALVSGILHQVGYLVGMPFQVAAGVPGAVSFDPGEPVVVLAYVVGLALLLAPGRRRTGGDD